MKAGGPRTRPGLVIRRTFQPDPDRAAAALAELLAAPPDGPVREPGGDSGIDGVQGFPCEDGPRQRRARAGQAIGHQRDRDRLLSPANGRVRAPRPGRIPASQG